MRCLMTTEWRLKELFLNTQSWKSQLHITCIYYSDASAFGYGEQNESNECFIDFSSFKKKSES